LQTHKYTIFFFTDKFYNISALGTKENISAAAKHVIRTESEAIAGLVDFIDADFCQTVELIYNAKGRLVVTGIGKSAIIAQKIVATMNSTGTPSMFLHASEAIHGDLGMVQPGDVVICISKSGNSPEIKVLAPILKRFGNTLVAMTGNITSFLAKNSDFVLNTTVDAEADPINLAPTSSTTAQLVMGDAIAVCLMEMRQFTPDNFAKYHPGGALGKKLLLRVGDMLDKTHSPAVSPEDDIRHVIFEISEKRLGVAAVIEDGKVIGIITDGDIRRMLTGRDSIAGLHARDIMTENPKSVTTKHMVVDALNLLEDFSITQLIVVDDGVYQGVIHLHDILKEGVL
jgi:arabinose-5-phosphate isomerase